MAEELLTVGLAAERLGCSKKWIYKLLDQERLAYKKFGSVYQIYASSVQAFRAGRVDRARNGRKDAPTPRSGAASARARTR